MRILAHAAIGRTDFKSSALVVRTGGPEPDLVIRVTGDAPVLRAPKTSRAKQRKKAA